MRFVSSLRRLMLPAVLTLLAGVAHADRVKDIASVAAQRSNQLIGYGDRKSVV